MTPRGSKGKGIEAKFTATRICAWNRPYKASRVFLSSGGQVARCAGERQTINIEWRQRGAFAPVGPGRPEFQTLGAPRENEERQNSIVISIVCLFQNQKGPDCQSDPFDSSRFVEFDSGRLILFQGLFKGLPRPK
jgi:hypothetical protein